MWLAQVVQTTPHARAGGWRGVPSPTGRSPLDVSSTTKEALDASGSSSLSRVSWNSSVAFGSLSASGIENRLHTVVSSGACGYPSQRIAAENPSSPPAHSMTGSPGGNPARRAPGGSTTMGYTPALRGNPFGTLPAVVGGLPSR